jgi:hypothetical protein
MVKIIIMKYILFCTLLLLQIKSLDAQCRTATDKEQQVINRLVTTLDGNLTPKLVDDDWALEMKTEKNILVAEVPSSRPLMFCGNAYRADFRLKESSPLYSQLNDSVNYYMEQSSKIEEGNQALKLMEKSTAFQAQEGYAIAVVENSPAFYLQDPGGGQMIDHYIKLTVPGTALAFQIWYKGVKGDEPTQQTVLCFGDWKNNLVKAADVRWYFPYIFRHEKNTPFIENIVIVIHADAVRANDIIKRIDWTKINAALTQ